MNSNVIKGLLGLCLLLLLVLIIEWLMTKSPEQVLVPSVATENSQTALTELPKLKMAKQAIETYSQMVERPLFIKGRKPLDDETDEQASTEEIGEIEDLILLGIYSIKGKTSALFKKMETGRRKLGKRPRTFLKKSEGEDVAGWLLKKIETDRVVMEQRGKEQTIMLRKPKPKSLSKPRRIPRTPSKKTKIKPRKTA